MNDLKAALTEALEIGRAATKRGRVVTYIPELASANPERLGVAIALPSGERIVAGDVDPPFTLQSVAKTLSLTLALALFGEDAVFERVGMEPTGDPFNTLISLEEAESKPLNPMINAGAIAVCSLLVDELGPEEAWERIFKAASELCAPEPVRLDQKALASERSTAHRNRALAHLLKELKLMRGEPEVALELYLSLCSLEVSCTGLAQMALFYAHPAALAKAVGVPADVVRTVNTFLVTCGMYNASGEFAIRVGIPAKSGVSGAIMAVVPGSMGIGVIGPALDPRGNSVGGVELLTSLSRRLSLSIFAK